MDFPMKIALEPLFPVDVPWVSQLERLKTFISGGKNLRNLYFWWEKARNLHIWLSGGKKPDTSISDGKNTKRQPPRLEIREAGQVQHVRCLWHWKWQHLGPVQWWIQGAVAMGIHIPYMRVFKNGGNPKSSILIGFSIMNHLFWGTLIYGNLHIAPLKWGATWSSWEFPKWKNGGRVGMIWGEYGI